MIDITECFGFSLTDTFGGMYNEFTEILTQDEIDFLRKSKEPCLLHQSTVEKDWIAIAIPGRYPRSYSEQDMIQLLENAISDSSLTMQSIYKKITDKNKIKPEDLTLYGEL